MNIMEYIAEERKLQGISATKFAAKLPFSRQRAEAIIASGDMQMHHVRLMLNVLGKDIDVLRKDGGQPDFDTAEFLKAVEDNGVYYHKEEEIIDRMGLHFIVVDKALDSAPEEKEI